MNMDQNVSYETPVGIIAHTSNTTATHETEMLAETVRFQVERLIKNKAAAPGTVYDMVLSEMERALFYVVLKKTNWNQSKAAAWLGISRATLRMRLREFESKL